MTACTYEKKPNPMPATLPNAKCGNLAVPPETGYIAPSSAWERARTMTMIAAMIQASQAPPPISSTAVSGANSQPEPMIDVSDAQVAPIRPSSRLRPTSVGVTVSATDSLAMFRTFFPGSHTEVQPPQLRLMVMIVKDHEKKAVGFISVTWITARAHVSALPSAFCRVATVSARGPARLGRPAHALRAFRWPRRKDAGGRHGGPQ